MWLGITSSCYEIRMLLSETYDFSAVTTVFSPETDDRLIISGSGGSIPTAKELVCRLMTQLFQFESEVSPLLLLTGS